MNNKKQNSEKKWDKLLGWLNSKPKDGDWFGTNIRKTYQRFKKYINE